MFEKKLPYTYTCETSTHFAPLLVLFIFSFFDSLTFLLYRSEVTKELSCWCKDQWLAKQNFKVGNIL